MTFTQGVVNMVHVCNDRLTSQQSVAADFSMFIPSAKVVDIGRIIKSMNSNKAPGDDKIRILDIKNCNISFISTVTKWINLSIKEGKVPPNLKKAIVKPIYKQGLKSDVGNYRPIAILPAMEKILEKYVSIHVNKYIAKHNIINRNQYGFQAGKSTEALLKVFANLVNSKLNKNKIVLVLFIDYSKAFDTINHETMKQTLDNIGIRGNLLKWFEDYLNNRTMKVQVGSDSSDEHKITRGVPQGSILGPTMYNLYVNRLFQQAERCDVLMFADDTAILSAHTNLEEAVYNLQQDYNKILLWSHDNDLIINCNKTKLMVITTSKRHIKDVNIKSHSYKCLHVGGYKTENCECDSIEEVNTFKYLGLLLDNRLTWAPHISNVCKSLRAYLAQFFKLQQCVNFKMLKVIYFALVHSTLRYGLLCYGHGTATNLKKIEMLNRKILKMVNKKKINWTDHIDHVNIYKNLEILPIEKLFKYIIILQNYYEPLYKTPLRGRYNFRNIKLRVPLSYNNYGERQDQVAIPKIMNTIPSELRNLEKIGEAKRGIKKWLLNDTT